jgi:hypothetical protein
MLVSSSSGSGPKKQIVIHSAINGEVLYTVPEGRKFEGYAWGETSGSAGVKINGVNCYFAGKQYNLTPISLIANTVLTKLATVGVYIVGIEEDA